MSGCRQRRSCALLSLLGSKNKLDQDYHPIILRPLASHLGETPKESCLKGILSFAQDRKWGWKGEAGSYMVAVASSAGLPVFKPQPFTLPV